MKIAQVSPLSESVLPKAYGGTERIVSYLTEELVRQGHEVTLFASGDSETSAILVPATPESIRENTGSQAWLAYHTIEMDLVSELADAFDIIHFHTDFLHFPITRPRHTPHVTTVHGRLDLPELVRLYKHFTGMPTVSISNSQRIPLPWVNWAGTVYHGLPPELYSYGPGDGDYFLFLGRISPEKRLDRAISIARACDVPLYIGAKIDKADQVYFREVIRPMLKDRLMKYIGEVGEREKRALLQGARSLIFPIEWPKPLEMVMIESFACGTPVVAYRCGSTPEIMEQGVTGFLVADLREAVTAARKIGSIDRRRCRNVFDERFTVAQMASRYVRIYEKIISTHTAGHDGNDGYDAKGRRTAAISPSTLAASGTL